jgi:hypothetical protein
MDQLNAFMHRFAGYGAESSGLWFVGLEEGGGRTIEELATRVSAWNVRGSLPLEDLAEYHRAIGQDAYFDPPYPLQRTWAALCRVRQAWLGQPADVATLKIVQARELGRAGGRSNVVELMPLPATSLSHWPYGPLATEHPALRDRDTYRRAFTPLREALIRELVRSGDARAVVFYGQRPDSWSAIAGQPLQEIAIGGRRCHAAASRGIHFISVPHPMARGLTSAFWMAVGSHLRVMATPAEP